MEVKEPGPFIRIVLEKKVDKTKRRRLRLYLMKIWMESN